jgi:hypothetical protein
VRQLCKRVLHNWPAPSAIVQQVVAQLAGRPVLRNEPEKGLGGGCRVSAAPWEACRAGWSSDGGVGLFGPARADEGSLRNEPEKGHKAGRTARQDAPGARQEARRAHCLSYGLGAGLI